MAPHEQTLIEKARDVHRTLNAMPLAGLPEREILQRVLHLANDPTDEQKAQALLVVLLSHGIPTKTFAQLARIEGSESLRAQWASIADERAAFRGQVEEVLRDRVTARRHLHPQIVRGLADVVAIPKLSLVDWRVTSELRYFALSAQAACAFALALLLDESKGFGAALRKCELSLCPNLFLSLPTAAGGRPPLYCGPEHRTKSANEDSRVRMNRWRQRKARKAK